MYAAHAAHVARLAVLASSLVLANSQDVTADYDEAFSAKSRVLATVTIDSLGHLTGKMTLVNESSKDFCVQLILVMEDSAQVLRGPRKVAKACLNGVPATSSSTDDAPTQLKRVVNLSADLDPDSVRAARRLRMRASADADKKLTKAQMLELFR